LVGVLGSVERSFDLVRSRGALTRPGVSLDQNLEVDVV